jgi:hypothetical protein
MAFSQKGGIMKKKYFFCLIIIATLSAISSQVITKEDIACDYDEGQFKNILIDGKYSIGKNGCMPLKIRDISPEEITLYDSAFPGYSICLTIIESQKEEIKEWQNVMSCYYHFKISDFKEKKIFGNLIDIWY